MPLTDDEAKNWVRDAEGGIFLSPVTGFQTAVGDDAWIALQLQTWLPEDKAPVPGATGVLAQAVLTSEQAEEIGKELLKLARQTRRK